MVWVAQHAALGLATLALCAAALRAASLTGAAGLERIVAAAPIAGGLACFQCMALGIVGLGSSPVALGAAAALTWRLAARRLPAPGPLRSAERGPAAPAPAAPAASVELAAWWAGRSRSERAWVGAAAGVFLALCAWLLRYPYVGSDGVTYHLNTVVDFVESGTPTDPVASSYFVPTSNHPLTNELLLSWPISIARSFVPATLWTPFALVLAGLAAWVGLRTVGVARRTRALAMVALCLLPLNVEHLGEPNADTPALMWLLCAAALAAGARRRPALLVPALVAGGLALGTKTTVLWPLVVALGAGAYVARGRLRPLARPMFVAGGAALVVGGYWYARNLIDHGFPLWPFIEVPWGDPLPRLIQLFSHTFLERPGATLEGRADEYAKTLAGALVLIPAALLLPFMARRREVTATTAAAAVALFLWASAPITGLGDVIGLEDFSISALRYLLPAMGVVILAVALAARAGGAAEKVATAVLAVAVAWNLIADAMLGFPFLPGIGTLLLGAVFGAMGAVIHFRRPWRRRRGLPPGVAVVAAALGGALLAAPASGWVERHGTVARTLDAELVRWFVASGHLEDDEPLAFTRIRFAPLAGDRLERRLDLIPGRESCAEARRRGWGVFGAASTRPVRGHPRERFPRTEPVERCRFADRPAYESAVVRVYAPPGRHTPLQRSP